MENKQDVINAGYTLSAWGTIQNPGKFEGEHWMVALLWERVTDGMEDSIEYDGDSPMSVFRLSDVERQAFDSPDSAYAILWESDSGFVQCELLTDSEYESWIDTLQDSSD